MTGPLKINHVSVNYTKLHILLSLVMIVVSHFCKLQKNHVIVDVVEFPEYRDTQP